MAGGGGAPTVSAAPTGRQTAALTHIPQVDGGQRERKACSSVERRQIGRISTVTHTVGHTYTVCHYSIGIVIFYLFFKNAYLKIRKRIEQDAS